ncbi:GAF domain-containing protein [Lactobacillus alvi]|uniref:GAF domain-containing protein n=1 Tax=Limosilactobacillus alvi TaxID=990412 RepID=A0ABS2ENL2_9LACO|nr:GAF domain-containing protein [Limosilactobacillus alvi]MBM6753955.1 GAF domain-containing protein [Limosilactobacillus alvi]
MADTDYDLLQEQAQALITGEDDWVAITANLAALLFNSLEEVNFAGFYRMKDGELILGPFQGQVACVHIQLGNGVCGTAAQQEKTIVVPNVHEFAGHIACDAASNSEIVVPVFKDGRFWGVLDIDSPKLNRFSEADQIGLEGLAELIFN